MVKVLRQLLTGGDAMQAKDIGVITPYSGQVLQMWPCILQTYTSIASGPLLDYVFGVDIVMQDTV